MDINEQKILEALKEKRLNHLKKSYELLIPHLTRNQHASIRKKAKGSSPLVYSALLISYFEKYNIKYKDKEIKEKSKEDLEKVAERQRAYVQRQKERKMKMLQVYISPSAFKCLEEMQINSGKTFSEIVSMSLQNQLARKPSWQTRR
ncbi:hypothetical protein [Sulfurimonas microaerophilic]|uniref:hypothetical protein n=1 Tax=Sulfurimonas microaerophilic TaxID=3058392 RepID=UPI0027147797|nr:hypothetical protein [Sulfurimonas sp. hsl 1-7]